MLLFAIRKFKNHPLTHLIEERIIFRLHECAKTDRIGVYNFALITLKHLQHRLSDRETHVLIHNLADNSEKLYFNNCPKKFPDLNTKYRYMAMELAFWLDKPLILKEMEMLGLVKNIDRFTIELVDKEIDTEDTSAFASMLGMY